MAQQWFVKQGDKVAGPLTVAQLKKNANAGRIKPKTPLRLNADGDWIPAGNVKGLFPDSAAAPKKAAPTPASTKAPAKDADDFNLAPLESGVETTSHDPGLYDDLMEAANESAAAAATAPIAAKDEDTVKCPACHAELSPEAVICIDCGFNLKTKEKVVAGSSDEEDDDGDKVYPMHTLAFWKQASRQMTLKQLIIYGGGAVIVIIGGFLTLVSQPNRSKINKIESVIVESNQSFRRCSVHSSWFPITMPDRLEFSGPTSKMLKISGGHRDGEVEGHYDVETRTITAKITYEKYPTEEVVHTLPESTFQ